jgi:thioredoxin-dependent peroxiredoxin
MARLEPGTPAPDFTLPSDGGDDITLSSLRGAPVVLVFYPKAMTSGCTQQACEFRDELGGFRALDATVLAISPDPVARLGKFRDKEGLTFPLLSDASHEVLEAYGVWVEKSMYGKTYMGVERSTFVVGPDGVLQHADYKVRPAGDATRVLGLLA